MKCTSEELKGRMLLEFMESAVYIRGIERKNVMEFMESEVYVRGIERKNVIRVHGECSVHQRN